MQPLAAGAAVGQRETYRGCFAAGLLAQAESPEERIVDFARYPEPVVPLIASHGRSRLEAKIATIIAHIVTILLQGQLHVANGGYSAVAVVGRLVRIMITFAPVGGLPVHRLRQTENRDDRKTEQAKCFHVPRYGHAKITQSRSKLRGCHGGIGTGAQITDPGTLADRARRSSQVSLAPAW